jgi:1-aminocyclopropane-1-carboxylate deaminase/D-cysteine desulfhydrase-like pyridoxal-dependent ACC family enzyme
VNKLNFGHYPTPVNRLGAWCTPRTELWLKRDDLTHPLYGGNKVRKLDYLLADAQRAGASRVVTVGSVGSHHVLATGVFGKLAGMRVDAALLPQPRTPHVLETLRASAAQGVGLFPFDSYRRAARQLKAWTADGAYFIPAGGTNHIGTLGMVAAVAELAAQVRAGELPEADLIVVPLGSGGTVAGLLAGLAASQLRTRVLAVTVAEPPEHFERQACSLAKALVTDALRPRVLERLEIERGYLGAGYGHSSAQSERATEEATRAGILLDPTYTAKAFAAALERVARGSEQTVLYWQTLSSAPLAPLLLGAPEEAEVAPDVLRLAR